MFTRTARNAFRFRFFAGPFRDHRESGSRSRDLVLRLASVVMSRTQLRHSSVDNSPMVISWRSRETDQSLMPTRGGVGCFSVFARARAPGKIALTRFSFCFLVIPFARARRLAAGLGWAPQSATARCVIQTRPKNETTALPFSFRARPGQR